MSAAARRPVRCCGQRRRHLRLLLLLLLLMMMMTMMVLDFCFGCGSSAPTLDRSAAGLVTRAARHAPLPGRRRAGEKVWRMPLEDAYMEQLKSSVAGGWAHRAGRGAWAG